MVVLNKTQILFH